MYRVLTALEVADVVNVGSEGPIYLLGKTPLYNENWAFALKMSIVIMMKNSAWNLA